MTRLLTPFSESCLNDSRQVRSALSLEWPSPCASSLPPTPTSPSFTVVGFPTGSCLTDCLLTCRSSLAQLACMETRLCTRLSTLLALLACGALLVWAFSDQIDRLLPWLVSTDPYLGAVVFFVLFVLVALPSSIPGYLLLNVAAGYRFGLVLGTLVVMVCALGGAYCAFVFCRLPCTASLLSKLQSDYLQAIVNIVQGEHSFKVIAVTRLTPIPFGLQNGVFAMANVPVSTFVSATVVGLFPNQVLSAYIGSTLRSVQDITNHQWNNSPVVIIQVCLSISLSFYVIAKAQRHLHRAIRDHKVNQVEENDTVHSTPQLLPNHTDHAHSGSGAKGHDLHQDKRLQSVISIENETLGIKDSVNRNDHNSIEMLIT